MATQPVDISRRVLLKQTAGAALLGGLGSLACAPAEIPQGPRITLPEPGPMIPLTPAILLTGNGRRDDPDEISVVWTFVVNGDPPQVGISAGTTK